jgi:hypothetical protein
MRHSNLALLSFSLSIIFASNAWSAPQAGSTKSSFFRGPKKLLAFATGAVVGAPIALVRSTRKQLVYQTKEAYTLGGLYPPLGWATAGFFGVPSGILCGVGYGLGDAVVDSYVNANDAPFSKASFSLEKMEW